MWNTIKVFILFSLLVALTTSVCLMIAGRVGLFLAFALSFIQVFIAYWFSDKIVLYMVNAKEIKDKKDDIYKTVQKMANSAMLPFPKVYLIPTSSNNAFATGRNPKNAVIALTKGIVKNLKQNELEGVIAHELAHIQNYDILICSIVAMLAGGLTTLSNFAQYGMVGRDKGKSNSNIVFLLLLIIFAPLAAMLIQLAISRSREYSADKCAATIMGEPNSLADALSEISGDSTMKSVNSATAHMFIANPLSGKGLLNLFSTHPPIDERIKRLRNI